MPVLHFLELHLGSGGPDLADKVAVHSNYESDPSIACRAAVPSAPGEQPFGTTYKCRSKHPFHLGAGNADLETKIDQGLERACQSHGGTLALMLRGLAGSARWSFISRHKNSISYCHKDGVHIILRSTSMGAISRDVTVTGLSSCFKESVG